MYKYMDSPMGPWARPMGPKMAARAPCPGPGPIGPPEAMLHPDEMRQTNVFFSKYRAAGGPGGLGGGTPPEN